MIDFVSTREGVDAQAAACARLLAAVISQAIQDACQPIPKNKNGKPSPKISEEVNEAVAWLVDPQSPLTAYAALIGTSADSIRAALLDKSSRGPHLSKQPFSDMDRRTLQIRFREHQGRNLRAAA